MTLINRKLSWLRSYGGGAKFWAWTASIVVHLIVLTAFGAVKFSKLQSKDLRLSAPMAKVSRMKKLAQAAPILPKPKMKKPLPSVNKRKVAKEAGRISPATQIFEMTKPALQDLGNWRKSTVSTSDFSSTGRLISPKAVEFFGSFTDQRKICYVVDCSGSMQGIFRRVQQKLAESIGTLQPDRYFYIIFFGNDKLVEFGDGRLVRATEHSKSAAYDFIDSVQPAGQTNAMVALERAVQIRDSSGSVPSAVYFLTDGFELTNEDVQEFSRKVASLLKRFAPITKINTIGFWPQKSDRRMLKEIARQSGGECVFVNE